MIQKRRRSKHQFGSTKSNKTFDKHNKIDRLKGDDELDLDPRNFDLASLIQDEELEFVDVNDPERGLIAFLRNQDNG